MRHCKRTLTCNVPNSKRSFQDVIFPFVQKHKRTKTSTSQLIYLISLDLQSLSSEYLISAIRAKMLLPLLAVALLSSARSFNMPHLPQNMKSFAKATSSALIGSTLAFSGVNLMQNSFPFQLVASVQAKEVKSVFEGQYNDPNHPGCLRKIVAKNNLVTIIGSDNIDGSNQWVIQAKEDFPGTIFVDFSSKGGPSDLLGN